MDLSNASRQDVERYLRQGLITVKQYNEYCDSWNNDCVRFGPPMFKIPVTHIAKLEQ